MTIESLLGDLTACAPEFEPFEPYVSGLTQASVPMLIADPFLDAAIRVYFGDLKGAHDRLQPMEGQPLADYLHGIIHRREGDFWNANYWFRRAGSVGRQIGIDSEALTQDVATNPRISPELRDALLNEWSKLIELHLQD